MKTSLFDLFKVGIGPSSSHTVGPMRAAFRFATEIQSAGLLFQVAGLRVELYGSLALTGRGHGTPRGVLLGLSGEQPDTVDPAGIADRVAAIAGQNQISLAGSHRVAFHMDEDIVFHPQLVLPGHPNALRITAFREDRSELANRVYYSIGGGFVVQEGEDASARKLPPVPYPFGSGAELLRLGAEHGLRIDEIVLANEKAWRSEQQVLSGIRRIWGVMQECTRRGLETEGILPGGLNVRRRAPALLRKLSGQLRGPLSSMDWLNVLAMAVNEENAAGGRVVTAPTNGAAGIIPAVAHYYLRFLVGSESSGSEGGGSEGTGSETSGTESGLLRYFLAAAAIGVLYKENASISGAEVGCQGEVGVACSMAAAGLAAALGGDNGQVEHAAEIGMEHNLGMTCDPIGGLVQIPCIERNAFGAVKAVNAARMSMEETGGHKVSLDQVIQTMYQTGLDMQTRYKETSLGGLAVNVIEC
ncbi:MAG TPA: L-serine ammonia-lyase [Candidatus Acidoferrales bacterium]|nr:L-serine ammonia-lyase [Candidatus Acidoferrales bacterium]